MSTGLQMQKKSSVSRTGEEGIGRPEDKQGKTAKNIYHHTLDNKTEKARTVMTAKEVKSGHEEEKGTF